LVVRFIAFVSSSGCGRDNSWPVVNKQLLKHNFHISTVHLDIIKVLFIHQLLH